MDEHGMVIFGGGLAAALDIRTAFVTLAVLGAVVGAVFLAVAREPARA